ncbi:MAG: putative zinc-binding protein [Methanomicrobiales archaeon]|nr:putative zinc-binding protein [Methanomicrobiales archaeon]MDI6875734.1 putative zinc-binding protein [Methanomicrobiales archaeon]
MTETPTCSCGADEPRRIVFPCAGQANTGQLSNIAAVRLTEEGFGSIACVALLATGAEGLVKNAKNADEVVVIDGCPAVCAKKIAEAQGIVPAQHVIVTECGIEKGPSRSYTEDDIETVVAAVWRGEGRRRSTKKREPSAGPSSGCGCGCDGPC